MSEMKLTAEIEPFDSTNPAWSCVKRKDGSDGREWIQVKRNGHYAGTICVETEHAQALTDYLNAYPHGTASEAATP